MTRFLDPNRGRLSLADAFHQDANQKPPQRQDDDSQADPNASQNDKQSNTPGQNGQGGPGGPGTPGGKPPSVMSRGALTWVLLLGVAVILLLIMNSASNQAHKLELPEFFAWAQQEPSSAFKDAVLIEETRIVGELREDLTAYPENTEAGDKVFANLHNTSQEYVLEKLDAMGQTYTFSDSSNNLLLHILISWGPIILIAFLIYFFFFRAMRSAGGGAGMLGSFGRSKHRVMNKETSNIMLSDVAGIDEAKEEVTEIIEFLKNPKKFQRLGGRVPRGVLLIGSPGCGKTLLAKAVAGEAEVPFFSISGSDFVEMFVGVGASRVRDLFKQAKDSSPCIVFLDEIDAVGRRRGGGFSSGGHDEREQTLNAILVEMDGFESNDQVIVMAATNRADVLDPALIRPGRFDRQINVPLPDVKGRVEILKVHSGKVKMSPDVNLERLARGTPMFSGAELAAIINEAAIIATLQNKDFIEMDDLEEARDKVKWGKARKSHKIEEDEKKVVAYHEAGHAVVMYYDQDSEPLHKVTIIPRGQALGVTFMLPEKDRHIVSKKQLLAMIRVSFGGRIAEEMFCGDQYNGTAGDIRQATDVAKAMVMQYGMSERLGFLDFSHDERKSPWEGDGRGFSEETARAIDEEVKAIIDTTYAETKAMISEHAQQTEALAEALLKYETLSYDEVDRIMKGEQLNKPTVADLLAAEKAKLAAAPPPAETPAEPTPADDADNAGPGTLPSPA